MSVKRPRSHVGRRARDLEERELTDLLFGDVGRSKDGNPQVEVPVDESEESRSDSSGEESSVDFALVFHSHLFSILALMVQEGSEDSSEDEEDSIAEPKHKKLKKSNAPAWVHSAHPCLCLHSPPGG